MFSFLREFLPQQYLLGFHLPKAMFLCMAEYMKKKCNYAPVLPYPHKICSQDKRQLQQPLTLNFAFCVYGMPNVFSYSELLR